MPIIGLALVLIVIGLLVAGLHIHFPLRIIGLIIDLILLFIPGIGGPWNGPWRR